MNAIKALEEVRKFVCTEKEVIIEIAQESRMYTKRDVDILVDELNTIKDLIDYLEIEYSK